MKNKNKIFYIDKSLNGQSQCFGCKQKGIWNVEWSSMMWVSKINGHHYCDKCKKEIEEKIENACRECKNPENCDWCPSVLSNF